MDVARMIGAAPLRPLAEVEALAPAILEASSCAQAASLCADACLSEPAVDKLRLCVRLNLDAADLCQTAVRLLSRQLDPDLKVIRTFVETCLLAVEACGDECERHAHHDHCRICLEACRRAQEAFSDLLAVLPAVPEEEPAASAPGTGRAGDVPGPT
jgi:hypothetical protein